MAQPKAKVRLGSYLAATVTVLIASGVLVALGKHINSTTVSLGLLLAILFVATRWGAKQGVIASIIGLICFNFLFLPPVGTLTIADPQNWVALAVFLITAVTVGQLSARARRRAEEAEEGRREIERLYKELREAFHRASHAEALRQSERLKSALLDSVTHDLRTPLTSIKASVTTLLEELRATTGNNVTLATEDRREMLEVIDEEADRLNRSVESLVELARIEAGEMQLRRRWAQVEEIIETAVERARPLTTRHHVVVSVEPGIPIIRVDAQAIAEVIYTLLDNATKYSPPGTSIAVSATQADDLTVRLIVEDEGRGIPEELHERVFDKFFRVAPAGASGSNEPKGTGLGLAIAKGVVEAHGGTIRIEGRRSKPGTLIRIDLPIGDEEPAASKDSTSASEKPLIAISGNQND
jgi:K+-sensing histidine kinase KdpD